jgi:hypothetical protein
MGYPGHAEDDGHLHAHPRQLDPAWTTYATNHQGDGRQPHQPHQNSTWPVRFGDIYASAQINARLYTPVRPTLIRPASPKMSRHPVDFTRPPRIGRA